MKTKAHFVSIYRIMCCFGQSGKGGSVFAFRDAEQVRTLRSFSFLWKTTGQCKFCMMRSRRKACFDWE